MKFDHWKTFKNVKILPVNFGRFCLKKDNFCSEL